mgnify:CR=1 FL=1
MIFSTYSVAAAVETHADIGVIVNWSDLLHLKLLLNTQNYLLEFSVIIPDIAVILRYSKTEAYESWQ